MSEVGRFAPSTTGPAHPGTLLAALLCWLDARSRGGRVVLRLEDLDPHRSRPALVDAMESSLGWLGLDWDAVQRQSEQGAAHNEALHALAEAGRLYRCRCSRADVRASGRRTPDGGWRYPGTCRERLVSPAEVAGRPGKGDPGEAIRLRLPAGEIALRDESGLDLSEDPEQVLGDPVVVRRDGAVAYHLASVVDDHSSGVTRVVRGRDLAPSSAIQVAVARLLGWPAPSYRHHLLLLEARGEKLAKLHGSVGLDALRAVYDAPSLCGVLASAAGLRAEHAPVTPGELLDDFDWQRVGERDRVLDWDGARLSLRPDGEGPNG
jgi:glutamyl-tRNA synthetase/glutamyl-Q tRNA(Asp) synthetase